MKKAILLLPIMLLLVSGVFAEYSTQTTVNITVTNETVQLVNEDGSSVYNFVAGSDLSTTWSYNIVRDINASCESFDYSQLAGILSGYNTSSAESIRVLCEQQITDLQCQIQNVSEQLTNNLQYFPLYTDCFYNLTIARSDLEDKASITTQRDNCISARTTAESQLGDCQATYRTTQMSESQCKKDLNNKNSMIPLWIIIGGAIVGGYWWMQEKKKHGKEGFGTLDTK